MALTLNELRSLYGGADGGEMHDPAFRAVAEKIFVDGYRRKWPLPIRRRSSVRPFVPTG